MSDVSEGRPRVLIEDWLPVAELGDESRRERTISVAIPPLSRIHVWWARRPLAASCGVVLAGALPSWSDSVQSFVEGYLDRLTDPDRRIVLRPRPNVLPSPAYQGPIESWYHDWVLHLCGIWGDPVAARRAYDAAVSSGNRIPNPYNYKQAYKNAIDPVNLGLLHALLMETWGGELPTVLDPTAGGGSIPFVSSRLGLPTIANDLNGVAAALLEVGVDLPATFGSALDEAIRKWARRLTERVAEEMEPFFPSVEGEVIEFYLFANCVDCPRTGRPVPLMSDFWLRKKAGKEVAVHLIVRNEDAVDFEIVTGSDVDARQASQGTMSRGTAISPYDDLAIDGQYIKAEAQAGRMAQMLYAVVYRNASGERMFRSPNDADLEALRQAELAFEGVKTDWLKEGFLPTEEFPPGNDIRPVSYGMSTWLDFFTPRQALVHGTFSREFRSIAVQIRQEHEPAEADAILLVLAMLQGKALNYNAKLVSWHVNQQSVRSVFDRHDFAFKSTFAEYQGSSGLYPWTLHVLDNVSANCSLMNQTGSDLLGGSPIARQVTVLCTSAASLEGVESGSVAQVCVDPPYYDNVMYAELSDFFFVWERRLLEDVRPEFFPNSLTDKTNEAVANQAMFSHLGRRKKELADLDYEAKMTAIFGECNRVLRNDGVLSVMFTHKRSEAWDTLGMSLLQAGFTIETSWPVNTESESSLHQANMNSAASTIMLVCRKRMPDPANKTFLDDIEAEVRAAVRGAAERFRGYGIEGVDLMLSTYGPALSVISSHWPVYSSDADESGRARLLRPDEALSIAREEVVRLTRQRIVGQDVQIDNHSDFVLIAWETFKAYEFSFDEARRLALTVGALDMDELARAKVLEKKSGTVRLLSPRDRVRRGADESATGVRIDAKKFEYMNDALDTVLYVSEVDGMSDAKALMDRLDLTSDKRFLAYVQGLVNAMPRVKVKGEWIVPEAGLLDTLVTAYLPGITLPAESRAVVVEAGTLFD